MDDTGDHRGNDPNGRAFIEHPDGNRVSVRRCPGLLSPVEPDHQITERRALEAVAADAQRTETDFTPDVGREQRRERENRTDSLLQRRIEKDGRSRSWRYLHQRRAILKRSPADPKAIRVGDPEVHTGRSPGGTTAWLPLIPGARSRWPIPRTRVRGATTALRTCTFRKPRRSVCIRTAPNRW